MASAGVEAKLDLVDVNFTSKLFTTVNPNINEVKVNPSLDFDGKMLKGHIDLFVEVDVLLYSKKWSVELFSFGGWDKSVSYPKQGVNLSKTLYAKKTSQNVSRSGGRKRNVTTAIL